jgi:SAM-dependent methyltransferase
VNLKTKIKRIINKALKPIGFELQRIKSSEKNLFRTPYPYLENELVQYSNLEIKMERQVQGGPFEWPNIIDLNNAVISLIGDEKRVVEIGCGTGFFAYHLAKGKEVEVVATDIDPKVVAWAQEHRNLPNITFLTREITPDDGPFDLVVGIEVIEHVKDYVGFLESCVELAQKVILTSPNKGRDNNSYTQQPPNYPQHIREWTAGEFYWVLRCFYKSVNIYSIEEDYQTTEVVFPINILSADTPVIAVCEDPIR